MKQHSFYAVWLLGCLAGGAAQSQGVEAPFGTAPNGPSASSAAAPDLNNAEAAARPGVVGANRLREGSKIVDQVGDFQKSADRINFFPKDGQTPLRVLENLAVERVIVALEDNPTVRTWSVTGVVTEFRGENYLLVTRAVLKARSRPRGSPERPLIASPAETPVTK